MLPDNEEEGLTGLKMLLIWAAAAIAILVLTQWRLVVRWLEIHSALSGWAQAIGAIGAIYGAFEVAKRQYQREQHRAVMERQRQAGMQRTMLLEIVRHIEVLAAASDAAFQRSKAPEVSLVFRGMIDHMRAPLDSMPYWSGEPQDMLLEALKIRAFCLNVQGAATAAQCSENITVLSNSCTRFRQRFA
jgi:hypothetical protein